MPKELTHLALAAEALNKLETAAPGLAERVRRHSPFLLAGAILCDSAYYRLPLTRQHRDISFLSEEIHGAGGALDADFLRRLALLFPAGREEAFLAFYCGIVSHHIVDRRYHPLVMHMTGDYNDDHPAQRRRSQARHRFLEGLIDLWMVNHLGAGDPRKREAAMHGTAGESLPFSFFQAFVSAVIPDEGDDMKSYASRHLRRRFRLERFMFSLYGRKWLRNLFLLANRRLNQAMSGYAALFYADEKFLSLPLFSKPFHYVHPFSGEKMSDSLGEMADGATEEILGTIREIHANFDRTGSPCGEEGTLACFLPASPKEGGRPRYFNTKAIDAALSEFLGI